LAGPAAEILAAPESNRMKYPITLREKYEPAMYITEPDLAAHYFAECVQHNMAHSGNSRTQAEYIERANLGYWAGYYSRETRLRVEQLFACQHPILGKATDKEWSSTELVDKGIEVGAAWMKKSGNTPDHASDESVKS
jgi:hypothetical protein